MTPLRTYDTSWADCRVAFTINCASQAVRFAQAPLDGMNPSTHFQNIMKNKTLDLASQDEQLTALFGKIFPKVLERCPGIHQYGEMGTRLVEWYTFSYLKPMMHAFKKRYPELLNHIIQHI